MERGVKVHSIDEALGCASKNVERPHVLVGLSDVARVSPTIYVHRPLCVFYSTSTKAN